ncbi:MAG: hypothetical protein R3A78_12210 [Polyangiales bacterium]
MEEINKPVKRYIEAVACKDKDAAAKMSREMLVNAEATYTLGLLGYSLMRSTRFSATGVERLCRMNAVIAPRAPPDERGAARQAARATLVGNLQRAPGPLERAQLLAVMRHRYDPTFLATFLSVMKDVDAQPPEVRLAAAEAYALLANRKEAAELPRTCARSRGQGPVSRRIEKAPAVPRCGERVRRGRCVLAKEGRPTGRQGRASKAAYMLGRTGGGNAGCAGRARGPLRAHGH